MTLETIKSRVSVGRWHFFPPLAARPYRLGIKDLQGARQMG